MDRRISDAELHVMEALWAAGGPLTATEIAARIGQDRGIFVEVAGAWYAARQYAAVPSFLKCTRRSAVCAGEKLACGGRLALPTHIAVVLSDDGKQRSHRAEVTARLSGPLALELARSFHDGG